MFINVGGKLINAAQVLWIEPAAPAQRTPRSMIRFANGESLTVAADIDWIARQQDAVVTAPAGYQVVRASPPHRSDEDQSVSYDILPVLAFHYRGETNNIIDPITPEGVPGEYFAIVAPDGRCWDVDRDYEDIEGYKQSFSDDWAKEKARSTDKAV